MDEILKDILKSTLVNKTQLNIRVSNPITGKKYPTRTFYVLLKKYAEDFLSVGNEPRMIGLAGLRGTGKTTLMWQLAEYLYNKKLPVYFFNVNAITASGYSLFEAIQGFQKEILKSNFIEIQYPFVLLFDEVHDDPNWTKVLKILYDEAKTAFIVSTGSSALLLNQTADLARRMKIEKVYPFRFIEFITAKSFYNNTKLIFPEKGLSRELKNILFYSNSLDKAERGIKKVIGKINRYEKKILDTFSDKKNNIVFESVTLTIGSAPEVINLSLGEIKVDAKFIRKELLSLKELLTPEAPVIMGFKKADIKTGFELEQFAKLLGIKLEQNEVVQE